MVKKSLRIRDITQFFMILMVCCLIGPIFCKAADTPKAKELRLATFAQENSYQSPLLKQFGDDIENLTKGAVKIKIYWVGQIAETRDLNELCRRGAIDIIAVAPIYAQTFYPLNTVLQNTTIIKETEEAAYVWKGLLREIPELKQEHAKQNQYLLARISLSPYFVLSSKPIRNLDDFKGIKIRAFAGPYVSGWMSSLGASNVNPPFSELYEGLMKKQLNAVVMNAQFTESSKLYEVAKYISYDFAAIVGWSVSINLDVWNKFAPEIKNAFTKAARDFEDRDLNLQLTSEQEAKDSLKQKGVQFLKVDQKAFYDSAPDAWVAAKDSLINKMGVDKALAERFMKRWRELTDEYYSKNP